MSEEFVKNFKRRSPPRKELFNQCEFETIADAIVKNSKEEIGFLIWTSTFKYITDDLKLYEIIENVSKFN